MAEFGRGFAEKNLRRMMQFAEVFPDPLIVAALLRQLGWTHFTLLIPIRDGLKRDFYAEMCRVERWSGGAQEHCGRRSIACSLSALRCRKNRIN